MYHIIYMRNKRSFKNYLLDPNFQLRYGLYFAAAGVGSIALILTLILTRLNGMLVDVFSQPALTVALENAISKFTDDLILYSALTFAFNVVFSVGFAIFMTHRIAGPAKVITSFIQEIRAGKYDSKRNLRERDDLQGIMQALKGLAADLGKK
jgi:hypothetical protein